MTICVTLTHTSALLSHAPKMAATRKTRWLYLQERKSTSPLACSQKLPMFGVGGKAVYQHGWFLVAPENCRGEITKAWLSGLREPRCFWISWVKFIIWGGSGFKPTGRREPPQGESTTPSEPLYSRSLPTRALQPLLVSQGTWAFG